MSATTTTVKVVLVEELAQKAPIANGSPSSPKDSLASDPGGVSVAVQ
jgi:hypothetical protein